MDQTNMRIVTQVTASDGFRLAATVHGAPSKRWVIIAPATGVPRKCYDRFAAYLARRGWPAITFDYRGIGGSRPAESLRGFDANMVDWAEKDLAAIVDHATAELGAEHVMIVGHSFGGQAVGLLPDRELASVGGLVGIGAQLGDIRLWPAPQRYALAAIMYGVVPITASTVGYLPGKLGIGEDLPSGVALQWARWCRQRGYYVAGKRAPRRDKLARLEAPVRLYSFADDRYAPARAVDGLADLLSAASVERRHLDPTLYGGSIGHFGFFRPRFESSLWPEVVQFFELAERTRSSGAASSRMPSPEQAALDAYLFDREARLVS